MPLPGTSPPLLAQLARRGGPLRWLRGWPRIAELTCPRSGGEVYTFEVDFFGMRYQGHLGAHIDRQVFFFDAYEKEELDFVHDWWGCRTGGIAVDIGANIGHHTLALSRIFRLVHAFEPSPEVLTELRRKLAANKLDNVVVHPFGLWDSDQQLVFILAPVWNTGMGSFKEKIEGISETATLPVRRGDDVLKELHVERIDFMKIDVQGAEDEVIAGLSQTIARSRPLVWMEISETTRQSFPTLASVINSLEAGPYDAFSFARAWPMLNVRKSRAMDEASFKTYDGNLILRPV
jgi:FkbM family methyltransferase